MDTWLAGVLLAILASLHFLHFGKQTLLLINVVSLHLTVASDLNKEISSSFFIPSVSSYFLRENLNPHKISNLSFAGSYSLKHTSSSFEGAPGSPDNNIPLPPLSYISSSSFPHIPSTSLSLHPWRGSSFQLEWGWRRGLWRTSAAGWRGSWRGKVQCLHGVSL